MTQFVESFATQQLLPPWEAKGAQTWGFAFRLTERRIRAYLAKYFNGGYPDRAPFHYSPLPGPQFGLLTTCYFPNVASKNQQTITRLGSGQTSWDHLSHTEVYLAFPVMRHAITQDNLLTDPTLVWVQPFVYSDNDSVVFSSREIWGTDMFLATIARGAGAAPGQFHLDAGMIGIKKFSPSSISELLAVLHISTGGNLESGLPELLKANLDLEEFVKILGVSGVFAGQKPEGVGPSPYPEGVELNNLKQFRDCYDMGLAIYRGIVASRTSHTEIDNIVLYDPAKVEIAFMWSDSIAEILRTILDVDEPTDQGPPAAHGPGSPQSAATAMDWDMNRVVVKAELGFSFTSNVNFEVIKTIYTYGMPA